jgi:hypothetical protein
MAKHQSIFTKLLYHGVSKGNGANVEEDRVFGTTQIVLSSESGSNGPPLGEGDRSSVQLQLRCL